MPIFYFIVWMLLIAVVGSALVRRQRRRGREGAKQLAAVLGFELLEGMAAASRMTPEALRQAAWEQHEKLPDSLRKYTERSARTLFCIAGASDGVQVAIYLESRASGRSNTTYTVVRADYPKPLLSELRIAYEGAFTRLGKGVFGLSDVEIGDAEFDRAVRIKAADEASARVVLGKPGVRGAILGLLALSKSAYATNLCAQWEQQGIHFDTAKTRERMAAVTAVARTLGNG